MRRTRMPARDELRTGTQPHPHPNFHRPHQRCNQRRGPDIRLPRLGLRFSVSSPCPFPLLFHLDLKRFAPEGNCEFGNNRCTSHVYPRGLKSIFSKQGKYKYTRSNSIRLTATNSFVDTGGKSKRERISPRRYGRRRR